MALIAVMAGAAYLMFGPMARQSPEPTFADPVIFDPDQGFVRLRDPVAVADEVTVENNVPVTMRDGVRLSAKVFRPKASGVYPVIMAFTAYDKNSGPDRYPAVLNIGHQPDFDFGSFSVSRWTAWEAPDPMFWLSHGYAVVYVDSRGYGGSEGDASVLSVKDGEDFFDAIEWAGTRPWSNGNVGLNGVSYLAISQWVAASTNPPHLKAIIPWEGQSDNFREVLFHGGIPETAFTAFWLNRIRTLAHSSPLPPPFVVRLGQDFPLLMKTVQAWLQPPSGIRLPQIKVPALICASWSDQGLHTRGSFEGFKQIASKQKWLFTHGRQKWATYYSEEALQTQKAFFDHFLKGEKNGFDRRPPVRLEVRETLDTFTVRHVQDWPIPNTRYQKLFVDPDGRRLALTVPELEGQTAYDSATQQVNFDYVFEEDTELSGNMKLKLWVSADEGSDMDLFVGVEKLDRQGNPVHFYAKTGFKKGPVAMGWLRVSHRELDPEKSTPWQPVLAHEQSLDLSPNEIVPVEIEILPSSTLFRKGETLRLRLQGRDLFTHPTLAHTNTVNVANHIIHAGGRYDSHLLVPVILPSDR